ncbi:MAG: hypothetical protein ACOYVD_04920 [Bacillota bacterium]
MKTLMTPNSIFFRGTMKEILKELQLLLADGNILVSDLIKKNLN